MTDAQKKILVVHRFYTLRGGEDVFIEQTLLPALKLSKVDHEFLFFDAIFKNKKNFFLDIIEVFFMILGFERLRPSFFKFKKALTRSKATHVMLNNVIPTLSLDIPLHCKKLNISTSLWVHNGRLSCANGLFFDGKKECYDCFNKSSFFIFKKNCFNNFFQKFFYPFIYRSKRVLKKFGMNIGRFLVCSEYSKKNIAALSLTIKEFSPKISLIRPPLIQRQNDPPNEEFVSKIKKSDKSFYVYIGRISYEKGADVFARLSKQYPHANFLMAGSGPLLPQLKIQYKNTNLQFLGFINDNEKEYLFKESEALIIPSRVPENVSLLIIESEPHKTPVVYPQGGGAEEFVRFTNRSGCSLTDFTAQRFERNFQITKLYTLNEFTHNLIASTND